MTRLPGLYDKLSPYEQWKRLPGRIFLDSDVVQFLSDFGQFIFEGHKEDKSSLKSSNGKVITDTSRLFREIEALKDIFIHIDRANFEFAISETTYKEKVFNDPQKRLTSWLDSINSHWNSVLKSYSQPFSEESEVRFIEATKDARLISNLSDSDRMIVLDAIKFDCRGLLTVDHFADERIQEYFYEKYKLMVMWPTDFIKILGPFQALYNG